MNIKYFLTATCGFALFCGMIGTMASAQLYPPTSSLSGAKPNAGISAMRNDPAMMTTRGLPSEAQEVRDTQRRSAQRDREIQMYGERRAREIDSMTTTSGANQQSRPSVYGQAAEHEQRTRGNNRADVGDNDPSW